MKIVTCQSSIQAAERVEDLMRQIASRTSGRMHAFLPTGRTPRELYRVLHDEKTFWSDRLGPIQIDEFVDSKRIFYHELKTYLLEPLDIEFKGRYIDPNWSDKEMSSHITSVTNGRIDLAVLGMGPNGHVGFHEPGLPQDFTGGRVTVAEETMARVPGATTREVLTFGVGTFLKAAQIILLVTGPEKRDILTEFQNSKPDRAIPATLLKNHDDLIVVTDIQNI